MGMTELTEGGSDIQDHANRTQHSVPSCASFLPPCLTVDFYACGLLFPCTNSLVIFCSQPVQPFSTGSCISEVSL